MTKPIRNELTEAVKQNDVKAVEELLQHGADVNEQAGTDGWSALMLAAIKERVEIARLLVAKGANVNQKTEIGITPLMNAGKSCCTEIARLLIENGAEVNAVTAYNETALLFAVREGARAGSRDFVSLLIDKGADVNITDTNNATPIKIAESFNYPELARLLKEAPGREAKAAAKAHATAIEKQQALNARARPVLRRLRP